MTASDYGWWHVEAEDGRTAWRGRAVSEEHAIQQAGASSFARAPKGVGAVRVLALAEDYYGPTGELRHDPCLSASWVVVRRCRDCGMPIQGETPSQSDGTARTHGSAFGLPNGCQRAVVRRLEEIDRGLRDLIAKVERLEALVGADAEAGRATK